MDSRELIPSAIHSSDKMPKAQKKTSASKSKRAVPLAERSGNASKQPNTSKTKGRSPTAASDGAKGKSAPLSSPASQTTTSNQPKDVGSANSYIIQVTLCGTFEPTITRLLSLPPHLTFDKLDQVLHTAFGWTNSHMHSFKISSVDDQLIKPKSPRNKLSLMHVSTLSTFEDLPPKDPPPNLRGEVKPEHEVTLADIYEAPQYKDNADIFYEYDHGDSWTHHLALLGRGTPGTNKQCGVPNHWKVACIGGEGHGAAEDAGGTLGWMELKEAFEHPRKKGNKDLVEWYKHVCLNGDPKGLKPYEWNVWDVNDGLEAIFFGEWDEDMDERARANAEDRIINGV